ncbi:MAG: stage III sporulation protein AE [Clostridium fessum]
MFAGQPYFGKFQKMADGWGQVILLGILGAVFASFSSLFADSQVSEMGFYVTYLLIFTLLAASFLNGVRITRTLLEQLFEFVRVLVPCFFSGCFLSRGSTSGSSRISRGHLLLSMWRNGCFYSCFCHAPSCMSCCRWRDI